MIPIKTHFITVTNIHEDKYILISITRIAQIRQTRHKTKKGPNNLILYACLNIYTCVILNHVNGELVHRTH